MLLLLLFICLVTQSSLTLCDPIDYSLPGSSVHGILQARTLEWVAISFSRYIYKVKIFCVMTLCCVLLSTDETLSQDCPERWSGPSLFLLHMLPESFSEFYSSPHFPLNLTSPPLLINQVSLPICQLITEISERICAITEHLDFQVLRLWLIALQDSHLFLFYIWPSFLQ